MGSCTETDIQTSIAATYESYVVLLVTYARSFIYILINKLDEQIFCFTFQTALIEWWKNIEFKNKLMEWSNWRKTAKNLKKENKRKEKEQNKQK